MRSQHSMPSTLSVSCGNRLFMYAGSSAIFAMRTCRSMSAKRSSRKILQLSCSPKYVTLPPTTDPRSISTGDGRAVRQLRNFLRALVANTGSIAGRAGVSRTGSVRRVVGVSRSKSPTLLLGASGLRMRLRLRAGLLLLLLSALLRLRRSGLHDPRNLDRLRWNVRLRLRLLLARLALHVDAAAEVRALRDGHARRDEVAVDRSVLADVDLVAGADVAVDFAEHDHRLREDLRPHLAVGADRPHVIAQLDR